MRPISERLVRLEVDGEARWGRHEGTDTVLDDGRRVPEADALYLAPAEPTKIIAVHLTYRSRLVEYAARTPAEPSYFMMPPSALNGHRRPVLKAAGSHFLNYEGELAVVVGRRMKGVPLEEALEYVGGYTCANDIGMHDFRHADRGSMLRVKGQDGFLPLGPELVPATEFDPSSFALRTYLNGAVVQEATADDLIWGVAYQLADLCRTITLEPGDVVLTGHAGQLAPDGGRRRRGGGDRRPRPAVERDRGVGRRPRRSRRAARGVCQHASRGARDPGGGGGGAGGRGPAAVIGLRRIDHVCLRVADVDEAAARWCVQFGLRERSREASRALVCCDDEPYSLELVQGDPPGHDHTAFELAHDCPLDEARAHLESAGVAWAEREESLFLSDPDGRGMQLMPYSAQEPWVIHARRSTTVRPGSPRKLGHVNCLTSHLDESTRFYTEVLGMQVTDHLGEAGTWFRVDTDHHVMALVDKGVSRFHHLAFDVVDVGQMRDALDHLARHGRWLAWGPARHGIGGNVASYVRIVEEPCLVELYCDMEQIQSDHEPRVWPDDRYSSNTWGPLPPRSYFRFDAAAVESERESLELQGVPLPPEEV